MRDQADYQGECLNTYQNLPTEVIRMESISIFEPPRSVEIKGAHQRMGYCHRIRLKQTYQLVDRNS